MGFDHFQEVNHQMSLLEIKDVTYRVKEKEIFSGLSLDVRPGEVHARLGITLAWWDFLLNNTFTGSWIGH